LGVREPQTADARRWSDRLAWTLAEGVRVVFLLSMRIPFRLGLGALCRVRLIGEERIPLRGRIIVAANHTSFADPVVLQAFCPRHLTYLMTDKYYHVPLLHAFVRFYGTLCVKEGSLNRDAIRAASRILEREGAIAIFPEGRISRDGLVHDAQPGVALLAQRTGSPILPVGLAGIERLLPPDAWRLRPSPITLYVGDPIVAHGESRGELADLVTRAIRACTRRAREATHCP